MERLLFESKGASKKASVMVGVSGITFLILGVIIMFISQRKHKTLSVYTGIAGDVEYSGELGSGGYVFSEEGRTTFLVMGVILIILGIVVLCIVLSLSAMYCKLYDYHLEGVAVVLTLKVSYNINYNEITAMSVMNNVLIVTYMGKTQRIVLQNEESARIAYGIIDGQKRTVCG